MPFKRTLTAVLIAASLGATFVAGKKMALVFDDVLFDFNDITTKAKGKAKGVGKGGGKEQQPRELDVRLFADDTFEVQPMNGLVPDGDPITGDYTRKNEKKKKLTLLPDQQGLQVVVDRYAEIVGQELEDEGVTAIVSDLQVTKQKLKLKVKTKKKAGVASAKFTGKLRFSGLGSIPEIGVNNVSFKLKAKLKGKSANQVPLDDITVDDE